MSRLCVLAMAGVMLTGCVSIPAGQRSALAEYKPSPNHALRKPTVIVLHYTVEDTLEGSRDILSDPDRKHPVSSHYLLDRDGRLLQLVPDHLAAWHAGVGSWGSLRDLNQASIGIEDGQLRIAVRVTDARQCGGGELMIRLGNPGVQHTLKRLELYLPPRKSAADRVAPHAGAFTLDLPEMP